MRLGRCAGPLHGQVVEFFCWNLECLYSPLKRSLFVDGDIFNVPNWCDIICQLQNYLFCIFFFFFFRLSYWPPHPRLFSTPEECSIAFNLPSKGYSPCFKSFPFHIQLYRFRLIINRRAGCGESRKHSPLMEESTPSFPFSLPCFEMQQCLQCSNM